jgi:hypothetical protein
LASSPRLRLDACRLGPFRIFRRGSPPMTCPSRPSSPPSTYSPPLPSLSIHFNPSTHDLGPGKEDGEGGGEERRRWSRHLGPFRVTGYDARGTWQPRNSRAIYVGPLSVPPLASLLLSLLLFPPYFSPSCIPKSK